MRSEGDGTQACWWTGLRHVGLRFTLPSPLKKEFTMQLLSKQISRGLSLAQISASRVLQTLLPLVLLSIALSQPLAGQTFTVKDLGTLPHGGDSSARAINDQGQIVGESAHYTFFPIHAFLLDNGVMTDLGALPGRNPFSEASGINNHGQIIGDSGDVVRFEFAVLFSSGAIVELPTLPGAGDNSSSAFAINDHGQIVGVSGGHAFLFDNGVITDLGTLPGDASSQAAAINDHGQIVGTSSTASGQTHAFLYENGVMTDLGTLPGDASSQAAAINDHGQIVGTSAATAFSHPHAFLLLGFRQLGERPR
jgi:probable HAF family extracellular repeat protein